MRERADAEKADGHCRVCDIACVGRTGTPGMTNVPELPMNAVAKPADPRNVALGASLKNDIGDRRLGAGNVYIHTRGQ